MLVLSLLCRRLRQDMKDKPLMSGVPTWSSSQELAKLTELAFERFEVGAFYAARNAVLR